MGKDWDHHKGGRLEWVAWLSSVLEECLRVTKPGGYLLCWALPRTSHWTGAAIEEAGWEIKDVITHLFGSGFPKAHDVSKAIDQKLGLEREVVGKSHHSANPTARSWQASDSKTRMSAGDEGERLLTAPASDEAKRFEGYKSALKPSAEFWYLALKPLDKTYAENAVKHGLAGLNIDGARIESNGDYHELNVTQGLNSAQTSYEWRSYRRKFVPSSNGRYPANVILDEEAAALLDQQSGVSKSGGSGKPHQSKNSLFVGTAGDAKDISDTGGASRFFYTAKASPKERNFGLEELPLQRGSRLSGGNDKRNGKNKPQLSLRKNHHPTVKPLELMKYLARLVSPPQGGVILDPFMGSGSTGVAALIEGQSFIGIEQDADYFAIATARIEHERRIVEQGIPLTEEAAIEPAAAQLELEVD